MHTSIRLLYNHITFVPPVLEPAALVSIVMKNGAVQDPLRAGRQVGGSAGRRRTSLAPVPSCGVGPWGLFWFRFLFLDLLWSWGPGVLGSWGPGVLGVRGAYGLRCTGGAVPIQPCTYGPHAAQGAAGLPPGVSRAGSAGEKRHSTNGPLHPFRAAPVLRGGPGRDGSPADPAVRLRRGHLGMTAFSRGRRAAGTIRGRS